MTGAKIARIKTCMKCRWWRAACADFWDWPRCTEGGTERDLSDAFVEGPDANCPIGSWTGLAPLDLDAEALDGRLSSYKNVRSVLRPIILHIYEGAAPLLDKAKVPALLVAMVARDESPLWLAVELADLLTASGLAPDAKGAVLLAASEAALADAAKGNDAAWTALRDAVEAGACTPQDAQTVADSLHITDRGEEG